MGSDSYHEPLELLSERTKNLHRAITSLIEELEAIDWYQQRAEACSDPDLKTVILHNRDEEVEHAMMTLEWIRRHEEVFDRNARVYLFSEGAITEREAAATGGPAERGSIESPPRSAMGEALGIGSLRAP